MTNIVSNIPKNIFNSLSGIHTKPSYNWAFIDIQNLYQGVKRRKWKVSWIAFREYLYEVHNVTKAVVFVGFVKEYNHFYKTLRNAGFHLEFRVTRKLRNGQIDGGNVDADLSGYVMDKKSDYNKAIIVADDGDYANTIKSLLKQDKLKCMISSHILSGSSRIIKSIIPRNKIISIHSLRNRISKQTNCINY